MHVKLHGMMSWAIFLLIVASLCCSKTSGAKTKISIGCGGVIAQLPAKPTPQYITSPGHPGSYPSGATCEWRITAPAGRSITLTMELLDTRSKKDILQICDEAPSKSELMYCLIYSGYRGNRKTLTTTGPAAVVSFTTNSSTTRGFRGFRLSYQYVKHTGHPACGDFPFNQAATLTPTFVTSPGYPSNYQANSRCSWFLVAASNKLIKFSVHDMETEDGRDTLTVYDGESDSNNTLGRFSGTKSPGTLHTTQRIAYVEFSTNSLVQDKGFNFSFVSVDSVGCGNNTHRLAASVPGVILSPGFPGNYPPSTTCSWNITAPLGLIISMSFNSLNNDVISVYDGLRASDPRLGMPFTTTGSQAVVTFRSNAASSKPGFQISFQSEKFECPTQRLNARSEPSTITSPGYPRSYPKDMNCRWEIAAPIGKVIVVTRTHMGLSAGDSLEVFDGQRSLGSEKLGSFSNRSLPIALATTKQHAVLKFTTDSSSSSSETGFKVIIQSVAYCGDPGAPDNGYRVGDHFTFGSSVSFYCDSMYKLSDDENVHRTCQADGQWSGSQPECNKNMTLVALIVSVSLISFLALLLIIHAIYQRCNKDDDTRVTQVTPTYPAQMAPRFNRNREALDW